MAGKRQRSGRKPKSTERELELVEDALARSLAAEDHLQKSREVVTQFLNASIVDMQARTAELRIWAHRLNLVRQGGDAA